MLRSVGFARGRRRNNTCESVCLTALVGVGVEKRDWGQVGGGQARL